MPFFCTEEEWWKKKHVPYKNSVENMSLPAHHTCSDRGHAVHVLVSSDGDADLGKLLDQVLHSLLHAAHLQRCMVYDVLEVERAVAWHACLLLKASRAPQHWH